MVEQKFELDSFTGLLHLPESKPNSISELEQNQPVVVELLEAARKAAASAYAPYSKFRVGSAALAQNLQGKSEMFNGCNIENASYGATMCAERVTIFSAVSQGFHQFSWMALSTMDSADQPELAFRSPCGMCRQVMSEFFDTNTWVVIDGGKNKQGKDCIDLTTIDSLLPWRFQL